MLSITVLNNLLLSLKISVGDPALSRLVHKVKLMLKSCIRANDSMTQSDIDEYQQIFTVKISIGFLLSVYAFSFTSDLNKKVQC